MDQERIQSSSVVSNSTFALACIETGLGSALHSFKIPLSGQLLSINQIFFLSRALWVEPTKEKAANLPATMSAVVALTKSLSPAGKRLTPMLAISMQGILFSLGPIIFGVNLIGLIVGAVFSSLWAFVQPILLSLLFLGGFAFDLAQFFGKEFAKYVEPYQEFLIYVIVGMIALKVLLSVAAVLLSTRISEKNFNEYQERFLKQGRSKLQAKLFKPEASLLKRVFRELNQPLMWISVGLSLVYVLFNQVTFVQLIWILLRPLAVAFIVIFVIHKLSQGPVLKFLRNCGYIQTARLLEETHKRLISTNL